MKRTVVWGWASVRSGASGRRWASIRSWVHVRSWLNESRWASVRNRMNANHIVKEGVRVFAPNRPRLGGRAGVGRWASVVHRGFANRVHGLRSVAERGTATAEYAIATLAACGFAALLLGILRSGEVRGLLVGIIHRALSVG